MLIAINHDILNNSIDNNIGYGIMLDDVKDFDCSHDNLISGNNISLNGNGVEIIGSKNNTFTFNFIASNNNSGIQLYKSNNNIIEKNNLLNNKRQAKFYNCTNFWNKNYWNRPRLFPKLIYGKIDIVLIDIPWFNIDWHPALKQ